MLKMTLFYGTVDMVTSKECIHKVKITERWPDSPGSDNDDRVSLLHSAWSALLTESTTGYKEFMQRFGFNRSNVPNAPHFENCRLSARLNIRLDTRAENKGLPPWTSSKGLLSMYPGHRPISHGAYPPWVCFSFALCQKNLLRYCLIWNKEC